jgi:hypothetical protein
MGTRGQKVYRWKGRYFVYYNHWDSYPSHFGLKVLHEIPRNVSKEDFEEWVRLTRENLDAQYEELRDLDEDMNPYVTERQPQNDLFIEWIYEIDLDNLVFHVDSQPLFRLDNMPPDDEFQEAISFDHFGHRAFHESAPAEFRYDWRALPPTPAKSSIEAYNSCCVWSSKSSINELLHIPMALSSIERSRTRLVEFLVARCMSDGSVGHDIRVLENVPDRDHIPQSVLELALSLVRFAVGPPIPSLRCPTIKDWDFIWVRNDVCLRITTHLDDEDNLQASIGDLVHHINEMQDKTGIIYGIACSIFHSAVVQVDKGVRVTSAHTPALQFLPSFYATQISTPGIDALSRLGCQASGMEFLTAISEAFYLPCITDSESFVTTSVTAKVPVELWMKVGQSITAPIDLVTLASISPQAMSAAADLALYPSVIDFRLVDTIDSVSPIPEFKEFLDRENAGGYSDAMGRAKFTAVRGDRHVNVELVQGHQKLSFKIETTHPLLGGYDLYVLELDDDKCY